MGYRSNVAMVISVDKNYDDSGVDQDWSLMEMFIAQLKLAQVNLKFWTEDYDTKFPALGWDNSLFVFRAENVKWYEDYPEVEAIEEVWQIAKRIEGLSGAFIRIGEEPSDIVDRHFGDDPPFDYVYVSREIVIENESSMPFGKFELSKEEEKTNE
jgi:hypothetical protein